MTAGLLFAIVTKVKKILFILTEFPPSIGGMQTHAAKISESFSRKGFQVKVYTYRCLKALEQCRIADSSFSFPVERKLSRVFHHYNLRLLSRAIRRFGPDLVYASTIFYGELSKLGVPVVSRSVGNDIMRPWIVYPFKAFSSLGNIPLVEQILVRLFEQFSSPSFLEALLLRSRTCAARRGAVLSSLIIANSHYTREKLIQSGVSGGAVRVLSGGVDFQNFSHPDWKQKAKNIRHTFGIPDNAFVLLTVSRMVDKKGIDFLVRVFETLKSKSKFSDRKLVLLAVGTGKRLNRFRRLAAQSAYSEDILFPGPVPNHEIAAVYSAGDIYIQPSFEYKNPANGLIDAETMGRSLLEAMAAGLPVLAANTGGIPSIVFDGHNGLLFEPLNESSLLDKVEQIANPQLRQSLRARGLELASTIFDWKQQVKVHQDFFAEIFRKDLKKVSVPKAIKSHRGMFPSKAKTVFPLPESGTS